MTECELVHEAEQNAEHYHDVDPRLFYIEQDAVEEFALSTIARAGFECYFFPMIVFMELSDAVGWCKKYVTSDGTTYHGAIYFDPRVLCKWTICHELAHWLDPGIQHEVADHNETFREIMVKLVEYGIGEWPSGRLAYEYQKHGFRYII